MVLRCFIACIWFGMQAFWGGQATRVTIGAIIPGNRIPSLALLINMAQSAHNVPGFANMPNSFSASSHLETKDLIGLVIWMAGFIPAILIKPEKLQIPFVVCFFLFCGSCFGLLIW